LRDLEPPELIAITGENFFRLFPAARSARDTGAIVTGDRRPGP
jgi:hypothetical protein